MTTNYLQLSGSNPFNSQKKMLMHMERIQEYLKTGDSTPILMEINLTNVCNLKCQWCISDYSHNNEKIDTEHLCRFFKEYRAMGGEAVTFSGGGEPTLHPDFSQIAIEAKNAGLQLGLMTNGVYDPSLNICLEMFNWVRFSLDTADKEEYKEIKGGDKFDQVIKNIKELKHDKKSINVNLPTDRNFTDKISKLLCLQAELDDIRLQIRPVLPRFYKQERIKDWMNVYGQASLLDNVDKQNKNVFISWDKYGDLTKDNFGRTYNKCRGHIFEPVMDANGDIVSCMYHLKNKDFIMGNIYKDSLYYIWYGPQRKKVKEKCDNLSFLNCQVCCKCHEINKFLHYINEDIEDVSFI